MLTCERIDLDERHFFKAEICLTSVELSLLLILFDWPSLFILLCIIYFGTRSRWWFIVTFFYSCDKIWLYLPKCFPLITAKFIYNNTFRSLYRDYHHYNGKTWEDKLYRWVIYYSMYCHLLFFKIKLERICEFRWPFLITK